MSMTRVSPLVARLSWVTRVSCLVLVSLAGLATAGCNSSGSTGAGTPQDRGVDPGQPAATTPETPAAGEGSEVNPYGKPYPTQNLGYQPRAGSRAGSVMRNYKFLGYRDGDPAKGKTVVSLAELFDPELRMSKLISFSAGSLWCPTCNNEAEFLVPLVTSLKAKKVTVIQAIVEGGARGTGSTLTDLDVWQKRHQVNYTLFLDPEQRSLGQFFEAGAVPWNALIDARSMEILASGVGFSASQLTDDIERWSKWVDENPAQVVK